MQLLGRVRKGAMQLRWIDQKPPAVSSRVALIAPLAIARNIVALLLPMAFAACATVYGIVSPRFHDVPPGRREAPHDTARGNQADDRRRASSDAIRTRLTLRRRRRAVVPVPAP